MQLFQFSIFYLLINIFAIARGLVCNSTYPINSVDPPIEMGYCKEEPDVCPSIFLSQENIHSEIRKMRDNLLSFVAINIGAQDGVRADPVYPLLKKYQHFTVVQVLYLMLY